MKVNSLFLPPATKLGQGYVFTRVCDSVHRGVVSQHALQVVSQHALQQVSWGVVSQHALQVVSQHALQVSRGGSPGPHPGGKWRGLAGGVPRPMPGGSIPACTKADPHPPPLHGRLLLRAVRILLDCILAVIGITFTSWKVIPSIEKI